MIYKIIMIMIYFLCSSYANDNWEHMEHSIKLYVVKRSQMENSSNHMVAGKLYISIVLLYGAVKEQSSKVAK